MSSIDQADPSSMHGLAADPGYPAHALAAIMQINRAKDPVDLLEGLVVATAAIGATAGLYTAAIPEAGNGRSSFTLFACHPGFALRQTRLAPLQEHPWFRFASTHTTVGTDRHVLLRDAADAEAIELSRQYGFRSCLVVPTPAGADLGKREMLCLGSNTEDDFEGEGSRVVRMLARSLAAELHDWVFRHLGQSLRHAAHLQETDIELLRLEREGLTTKEIARRTGMSWAAVDSRFYRMNVRLACANRKDSARRAAEYGLLEPVG